MSWGIQFTTDVFIPRMKIETKEELLRTIVDTRMAINESTSRLLMLAAGTPKDIIVAEEEDCIIRKIKEEVEENVEELLESSLYLQKLEMFLQYIEDNPDVDIKSFNS